MDSMRRGALMALTTGALLGIGAGAQANTFYFQLEPTTFSGPPSGAATLFVIGPPGAGGTVSSASGFSQSVTLDADGYASVALPTEDILSTAVAPMIENKGLSLTSAANLKAYVLAPSSGDMLAPIDAGRLGTDYVVAGYHNERFDFYQTYNDQLTIQATRDNTAVTITGKGGFAGTVTLDAGQTYILSQDLDMTGWSVSADKPIAVQSGTLYADIPNHPVFNIVGAGHVVEQLPSIDKLSRSYVLPQMPRTGFDGNVVRVVATADDTGVQINGVTVVTLNKGEYYEGRVTGGEQINADHPVLVAEYMLSNEFLALQDYQPLTAPLAQTDAAMTIVPGTDQWQKRYVLARFSAAVDHRTDYAGIVIETGSLPSLQLDGTTVDPSGFAPIGSTGYSYGSIDVSGIAGVYTLAADTPFEVLLAGLADGSSYLTYGGATFIPGTPLSPPQPPARANVPPGANGDLAASANTLYFQIDPALAAATREVEIFGVPSATGALTGSGGFSQPFTLDANGYAVVQLPASYALRNGEVENKGLWITSSAALNSYYVTRGSRSSGMTALIRGGALGSQYRVAGYHYDFQNGEDWTRFDDQVTVQATQDDTHVTIAPNREQSFQVALNAGQTYRYAADHDISGSSVTADKPIVFQTGNVCAGVPNPPGGQCGLLRSQLPPLERLTSTHYLLAPVQALPPGATTADQNYVRVVATADDTDVTFNGNALHIPTKGAYQDYTWKGALEINATHPVLVVDFLYSQDYLRLVLGAAGAGVNSGPSMTVVPGTDQWQSSYVFATPAGAADFQEDYANVVIETGSLPSLRVGGSAVDAAGFQPIGATGYSYGRVDVSGIAGAFTLTADKPFGLLFAGFDDGESYLTYGLAKPSDSPGTPSGTPDNTPPVANDDAIETGSGGGDFLLCSNDTDPDGDVVNVVAVSPTTANGGTVTLNVDGSVHYVPPAGYAGEDSFSYTLGDGKGGTAVGNVKVTVAAAEVRPANGGTGPVASPGSGTSAQSGASSSTGGGSGGGGGGSLCIAELLLVCAFAVARKGAYRTTTSNR